MPDELSVLDAGAARRWAVITRASLAARRAEIDALNVFPVPDGDTGTNLYLTFDGALDAARTDFDREHEPGETAGLGEIALNLAKAMLLSARGNSGVILSQIFQGLALEVTGGLAEGGLDGPGLARAIRRSSDLAWDSVTRPVEGTILSVARASAEAAEAAAAFDGTLAAVTTAALQSARHALARTTSQLPELGRAGVVDAGGAGYLLLLEALDRVVSGERDDPAQDPDPLRRREGWVASGSGMPGRRPVMGGHGTPHPATSGPAYEVMYLLQETSDAAVERLKAHLDGLGDSVLVVGSGDLWNVHAHVDDVGAAIEAGIEAGRPRRITVTHFGDQVGNRVRGRAEASCAEPTAMAPRAALGVVACAAGEGLAGAFESVGAVVVRGGPGRRASAGQLVEACRMAHAHRILVLPNDPDMVLAAQAAASAAAKEGMTVTVLPSVAAVQGVAALAVYDPGGDPDETAEAMAAAVIATRHGSVSVATRTSDTAVGPCREGDVLGLVDGHVTVIGDDLIEVATAVVTELLGAETELVTIVSGADAPTGLAQRVQDAVAAMAPEVEVDHVDGGQGVHSLLFGVE